MLVQTFHSSSLKYEFTQSTHDVALFMMKCLNSGSQPALLPKRHGYIICVGVPLQMRLRQ